MCSLAGFVPDIFFEACDTQTLAIMVKTQGVAALIPQTSQYMMAMGEELGSFPMGGEAIRAIPLEDTFCVRHSYLLYHNKRILMEDARQFLDFILKFRAAMEQCRDVGKAEEILLSSRENYNEGI